MGKPTQKKLEKVRKKKAQQAERDKLQSDRKQLNKFCPKIRLTSFQRIDPTFTKVFGRKVDEFYFEISKQAETFSNVINRPTTQVNAKFAFDKFVKTSSTHALLGFFAVWKKTHRKPTPEQIEFLEKFLGEEIYAMFTPEERESWFPTHSFRPICEEKQIVFVLEQLESKPGSAGKNYYSRFKPTLKGLPISYSIHALKKIYARISASLTDWLGLCNIIATIDNAQYEYVELLNGHNAFSLIAPVKLEEFPNWKDLIDYDPKKEYGLRIGYCPFVQDGPFLRAKTFLPPGFKTTPESPAVRTLPFEDREAIQSNLLTYYKNIVKYTTLFHSVKPQIVEIAPRKVVLQKRSIKLTQT